MADVWNNEAWDRHMSRWRYLREIVYIFRSRLLKRIAPQLTVTLVWAYIVCKLVAVNHPLTQKMHMSLTSLSLVSTFVAALLTLRSNQGLSRLAEARSAWGRVVALSRDTAQSMATYVYPLNPELGILSGKILAIHISIVSFILCAKNVI
jgi:predicted membrane chloride channel (bestrophin family)